jgi:hypothetical protein
MKFPYFTLFLMKNSRSLWDPMFSTPHMAINGSNKSINHKVHQEHEGNWMKDEVVCNYFAIMGQRPSSIQNLSVLGVLCG